MNTGKRIAIIGATGMLGSMVYGELLNRGHRLTIVIRDTKKLPVLYKTYGRKNTTKTVQFDLTTVIDTNVLSDLVRRIGSVDGVINCSGIIPQQTHTTPSETVIVNSIVPHMLSLVYGDKLIHVTTDCVFDGKQGAPYFEKSMATPDSLYGTTKYVGEPKEKSLVIRTSFVGPELDGGSVSLLGWFLSQKKEVKGFINHRWNGITTREFARICHTIITKRTRFPKTGLYHVNSTDMTKYGMLCLFAKKYGVKTNIIPCKTPTIDRRLATTSDFCGLLHIPPFETMLDAL